MTVTLYGAEDRKIRRNFTVHRLVAMCFLPNPENLPQINHIDGEKTNNKTSNLEWCTQQHNMDHAAKLGLVNNCGDNNWTRKYPERVKRGKESWAAKNPEKLVRGERHGNAKLTDDIVRAIKMADAIEGRPRDLASRFGIPKGQISLIRRGIAWKHITLEGMSLSESQKK